MLKTLTEKLGEIGIIKNKNTFIKDKFNSIEDRFNTYKDMINKSNYSHQEKFYLIKGLESIKNDEPLNKINYYIHSVKYKNNENNSVTDLLKKNYIDLYKNVLSEKKQLLEYRQQLMMLEGDPFNDYTVYEKQIKELKKEIKKAHKNLNFY